jgi:hypothetical protein
VPPLGPVLDETDWDRVLVTVARCTDGSTLELRMEPVDVPLDDPVGIELSNLPAGVAHRLHGDGIDVDVVAGADGRACAELPDLRQPVRLLLEPKAL